MRALTTLCVLCCASAWADEVELFIDHGDTFIRAGTDQGLQRGVSVSIVAGKERHPVGTATVMEVWGSLSRVALDEPSRADKTAQKYAVVPMPKPAEPPAVSPPPAAPAVPVAKAPVAPAAGTLTGHAVFRGAGRWKILQLFNDGGISWSQCTLTLMPNNQRYALAVLRADDHEAIAWSNFSGDDRDKDPTWVAVRCAEGQGSFRFPVD